MFYLAGLGLDLKSIGLEALEICRKADKIYIENYTVEFPYSIEELAELIGKKIIGDPTEASLLVSAAKAKLTKEKLEKLFPRINEIPFSSERKLMSTIHKMGNKNVIYTKGSPEKILKLCNKISINNKIYPLTTKRKNEILNINDKLASSALRVLGFAYKENSTKEKGLA